MTRWMIETMEEAPPSTDDFVNGLEAVLNAHLKYLDLVHPEATTNPLEWTTALLEGLAFLQHELFNNPDRKILMEATLNLANIAITFNRSLNNGTYTQFGIREIIPENVSSVSTEPTEEAEVQGSSENVSKPAQDQHTAMGGGASPDPVINPD